uniref:Transmembrane protein 81 n=1 Tax=Denticeps clupeoides TaxID=299321 RepID=A0AAY4EJB3_9TELE
FTNLKVSVLLGSGGLALKELEELDSVESLVVTHSSPCSATCGLGIRTQELCRAGKGSGPGRCQVRQVSCLDTWQCGLQTLTVPTGQKLTLDCLGEVTEAMGRFSFIVWWRHARGVVTTNSALFVRLKVSSLDHLTLDPVKEEHAGTYRCDVLDSDHRRVKRLYKGLKVINSEILHLDFTQSLNRWEKPRSNSSSSSDHRYPIRVSRDVILGSVSIAASVALVLSMAFFYAFCWGKTPRD